MQFYIFLIGRCSMSRFENKLKEHGRGEEIELLIRTQEI